MKRWVKKCTSPSISVFFPRFWGYQIISRVCGLETGEIDSRPFLLCVHVDEDIQQTSFLMLLGIMYVCVCVYANGVLSACDVWYANGWLFTLSGLLSHLALHVCDPFSTLTIPCSFLLLSSSCLYFFSFRLISTFDAGPLSNSLEW